MLLLHLSPSTCIRFQQHRVSHGCLFLKVDWLNKFIETMWPFLDKVCLHCIYSDVCFCCPCCLISLSSCLWALILQVLQAICKTVRETVKPIIAEQIPQYKIDSVEFEALTLGSLPPTFQGSNCFICLTHTSMMSLLLFFSPFLFILSMFNEICLKEMCETYWNGKLLKIKHFEGRITWLKIFKLHLTTKLVFIVSLCYVQR